MKLTPQIYSVGQFLDLVNVQLEEFSVAIQGEITSVSLRNHAYFTIADSSGKEQAVLNCALWQSRLNTLSFELKEGIEVQILGRANVYKPTGRFTFIVEHIAPVGEGALQQAFEALKRQLEVKGYFAPERKRALPAFPTRIGLLTSASGEALRDFKQHLGQFGLQVIHKDVRVEGLNAVPSIVVGIDWFNRHPEVIDGGVEVLVLTRGGGSLESLQAFNSMEVAQAIFASKIPVISAVGHERDVTIADLVADIRASTPTDAGRIISENWRLAETKLSHLIQMVQQSFSQLLFSKQARLQSSLETMFGRFFAKSQEFLVQTEQFFQLSVLAFENSLSLFEQRFDLVSSQVSSANPRNRLKQGYSIVTNLKGRVIKTQAAVKKGETLDVTLHQGSLKARVQ